jgi:RHS repeat-associated protein
VTCFKLPARADDSLVLSQTYDRIGNVTSEARGFDGVTGDPGTGTQTFSYDPLDRLIESELGSDLRSYTYDLDGNRLSRDEAGVLTTYTYDRSDAVIEQTIGTTATAFAYDGFGNLTGAGTAASGTTAYAYDLGDRLIGLTPPGASATTFSYDALGRIATRSVSGAGTDSYSYVGLSEDAWQVSNGSAATASLVGPNGSRLSVLTGSTLGWTIPDLHGSLVATTDSADALSSALRYDGYGQTQSSWSASGPLPSPWRYQGRLELSPDAANPLYENGARSYSPGLGAFTQLDSYTGSAQDPLSMNRYLYAEANPATLIDPTGHYVQRGPDSDLADSQLAAGTGGGQQAAVYQAPVSDAPAGKAYGDRPALSSLTLQMQYLASLATPDAPIEWTCNSCHYQRASSFGVGLDCSTDCWILVLTAVETGFELCLAVPNPLCGPGGGRGDLSDNAPKFSGALSRLWTRVAGGGHVEISINADSLSHIADRHLPGGSRIAGRSVFVSRDALNLTIRAAERVTPLAQANGNLAYIVDMPTSIGIDRTTGLATSVATVITRQDGSLVTAFPGAP